MAVSCNVGWGKRRLAREIRPQTWAPREKHIHMILIEISTLKVLVVGVYLARAPPHRVSIYPDQHGKLLGEQVWALDKLAVVK